MRIPSRLVLTALVPAVLLVSLIGCGNDVTAEIIGTTGVTVDQQGDPLVLVQVCRDDVDVVEVVGGRGGLEPDEPNPTIGRWTTATPQDGSFTLDLAAPAPGWSGPATVDLEGDSLYIVSASRSDADAEVVQASFRPDDLVDLDDEHVIVRDGEVLTRSAFDSSCDDLVED